MLFLNKSIHLVFKFQHPVILNDIKSGSNILFSILKMKIIKGVFFFMLAITFLFSCNSRQNLEKQADVRLKHIEQLINHNSLNEAKIEIDSFHMLFPRLVNKRRIAAAYSDTIVGRESSRSLAYCDSILPLEQHAADSIQKNFRYEKDKIYQETGNFIYKTQNTENNATRIYLKAYVDDNADYYLISNYCGPKLEHTSVEVSTNNLFAHTDTINTSDPDYHSFTDDGLRWEVVTFKNESGKTVSAFIAQNVSQKIKVILHGKKDYVYFLADSDKKAIYETYNLWIVKKDILRLQFEIKKATAKIERITAERTTKIKKRI